jgi:hypothetical protein
MITRLGVERQRRQLLDPHADRLGLAGEIPLVEPAAW